MLSLKYILTEDGFSFCFPIMQSIPQQIPTGIRLKNEYTTKFQLADYSSLKGLNPNKLSVKRNLYFLE